MNRKQFITLLVLGLLIGGLGVYLYNQRKESYGTSYLQSGQRVLPGFPINDITHIRIQTPTNEVNLRRGEDNIWTVEERWGYPASFADVSGLLRNVWQLEPVQDVQAGPSQYGRLHLLDPKDGGTNSATLVEFRKSSEADAGGTSILLGKQFTRESSGGPFGGGGTFPVGRYVLVPGTKDVWLVSETFSNVTTDPEDWLEAEFIKVEKVKSIAVTRPGETNSWTMSRETESGPWQLQDVQPGEKFDSTKASSLNFAFSSPRFEDIVSPETSAEQTGLDDPITARLETLDGFAYTLHVGNETNGNYYVKVEVTADLAAERAPGAEETAEDKEALDKAHQENLTKLQEKLRSEQRHARWVYLVPKYTVDSLLKNRGDFMAAPEAESDSATSDPHEGHDHSSSDLAPDLNLLPPELQNLPVTPVSNPPSPTETPAASGTETSNEPASTPESGSAVEEEQIEKEEPSSPPA